MRLPIEIAAGGGPETPDKWRDVKFPFALSQPPQNSGLDFLRPNFLRDSCLQSPTSHRAQGGR